ncbi:MAG TPA: dihydrodipicolinate synthase family protein [Desulfobacteraceae bacterium]|nr:dihydrodipicolinate synthase family protein [Desulfobacteraceae bacterium]
MTFWEGRGSGSMEALTAPRGLIVELVTPFTGNREIDGKSLAGLLARVSSSAQGVFLAGPHAGDGTALSPRLRADLLKQTILALDKDPVPIFIWVTQESEEKTRETLLALSQTVKAHPCGAGLFYVDTPLYYHSNRGLSDLYRGLCLLGGGPFILHNDPELIKGLTIPFKRNDIRTAILKELAGFEGISGLIFSGSLDRAHNYQRACRQRPDFRIYDGDESRFLDHPSRSGIVSAGANLAPAAWGRIVKSSLQTSNDGSDYPDRLQQIWETGGCLRRMRDIYADAPSTIIKDVLAHMGIMEPPVQTPENIEEVRTALRELMDQLG